MQPITRSYGARPSTRHSHDMSFRDLRSSLVAVAPQGDYVIPAHVPVWNQGGLGSCVAHGVLGAWAYLRVVADGALPFMPSRLTTYWSARKLETGGGEERVDNGTTVRSGCVSVVTVGVARESAWVYDESRVNDQPADEAFVDAADHKSTGIEAFHWVDSVDDCETSIRSNLPIVIGGVVGSAFENAGPTTVLDAASDKIGGHCTALVGLQFVAGERHFLLRNSWGEGWGNAGLVWVRDSFVESMWERFALTVAR